MPPNGRNARSIYTSSRNATDGGMAPRTRNPPKSQETNKAQDPWKKVKSTQPHPERKSKKQIKQAERIKKQTPTNDPRRVAGMAGQQVPRAGMGARRRECGGTERGYARGAEAGRMGRVSSISWVVRWLCCWCWRRAGRRGEGRGSG